MIKKFVTEAYWRIEAKLIDEKGKHHNIKWCRGKIFDKTCVSVILNRLNSSGGCKEGEVLSVKKCNVK